MTQPRQIEPGSTYLITRRTVRRHMLFRPDEIVNALFVYVLAFAARRGGVLVHAYCVMSTHVHLVVTDPRGELPTFLQWFHRIVAMTVKVLRRWEGSVWDGRKTSVVRLETPEAVVDKIAYTLANPVAAGLVRRASDWPGARSTVHEIGRRARSVVRPSVWFAAASGMWPDRLELSLEIPPMFAHDPDGFRESVGAVLSAKEREAHEALRVRLRHFVGAEAVLRRRPSSRIDEDEPASRLSPTFAVGPGHRDRVRAVAEVLKTFRDGYRSALAAWRNGARDTVFPAGTWAMRVVHGARVATDGAVRSSTSSGAMLARSEAHAR